MEEFIIQIKEQQPQHALFLKERRVDPYTHEVFKHNDKVIVTSYKEVWLYLSWQAYGIAENDFLKELPINRPPRFKPGISTFTSIPSEVSKGQTFTLKWTTTFTDKVHIDGVGTFNESHGSTSLVAKETNRYILRAINMKGESRQRLTINVLSPVIRSSVRKLDFGKFSVNEIPVGENVQITNSGTGVLDWQIIDHPAWIAINRSQLDDTLRVSIIPSNEGALLGQISIHSNGGIMEIPVRAHIIPLLIKEFSVEREGYRAKVSWQLHRDARVWLGKTKLHVKGKIYLPYLHKREITLSAEDRDGNKDSRTYRINVPIPKLSRQTGLKRISSLAKILTLQSDVIRLIRISSRLVASMLLQIIRIKLSSILVLNNSPIRLEIPQPLAPSSARLKDFNPELQNPSRLNPITIKIR